MFARKAIFIIASLFLVLSTPVFANPSSPYETHERSFDGTVDDLKRMQEECSQVKKTSENAEMLYACNVGCKQAERLSYKKTERPLTGRAVNFCLNGYDAVAGNPLPSE